MSEFLKSPARAAILTYLISWAFWYLVVMGSDFENFLYYFATLGGAGKYAFLIQLMAVSTTILLTLAH